MHHKKPAAESGFCRVARRCAKQVLTKSPFSAGSARLSKAQHLVRSLLRVLPGEHSTAVFPGCGQSGIVPVH